MIAQWRKPCLEWLLVFVPAAILVRHYRPESHVLIFCLASAAIIPLAGLLGDATEHLAERTSQDIGGLLNATFGNASELILALAALQRGLTDVVKASLTGSIIGNILLVLGLALVGGGLRHKVQRFSASAARIGATMLMLAAIALVVPAGFHHFAGSAAAGREGTLSLEISAVLLLTYGLSLLFSLYTHVELFSTREDHSRRDAAWSKRKSLLVLGASTALVAWMSEILVGSVEAASHALGMSDVFVGVVLLATIGNAAEHASAIRAAYRNKVDLAIGITIGSSTQIALFVAPVLVIVSHFWGPKPLDLAFSPGEVVAVALAVIITGQIASDGESNWLEGALLLSVYAVLALAFYFLPSGR